MTIQGAVRVWGLPRTATPLQSGATGYSWALSVERGDGTITITQGGPEVVADPAGTIVSVRVYFVGVLDGAYETQEGIRTITMANGTVQSSSSTESQVR
jgi:hypothetical protein